jgi:hypothetical protein
MLPSFPALSGGFNWFAFQMLTGCDTQVYKLTGQINKQGGEWKELFTSYASTPYSIRNQNTVLDSKVSIRFSHPIPSYR